MLPLNIKCILSFFIYIGKADATNVALGKPAFQTDTCRAGGPANNANDGDLRQDFLEGSCSCTLSYESSWWVDLGQIYAISSVKIYNRMDCCSDRLRNVEIHAGYEQYSYTSLVASHAGTVGSTINLTLTPSVYARWVEVTIKPPFEHLTLCEVQVEGSLEPISKRQRFTQFMQQTPHDDPFLTIADVRSRIHCVFLCHSNLCTFALYDNETHACALYQTVRHSFDSDETRIMFVSSHVLQYMK
ncbi:fucolectin-like [Mya arenaria]|uniref:fucolectin-like n=1 Tax=Mya arenaria TaxID=6604 RepID=UPI0022E418B2|nr:fucolectin-like [Mya arenaria]